MLLAEKLVFITLKWLVHLMFFHNFKQWCSVEYVGGMNFFRAFLDAFSRKTCIYYSKMVGAFNVFPQFQAMVEK
jgi:hypothetical protein